jgi:2-amino-4-hydroxy-6-hydroxymethyldihydropteridine diphosphokinase
MLVESPFPNIESRPSMDKVFIEGLEIEALIGIYDWERRVRQPLRFDIEMAFDNRRPAASDAIADTLDYQAISKRLIEFVSQSGFGLVETLAERCATLIIQEFGVGHVRLKLSKPGAVRGARAVGVVIERSRAAEVARPAKASDAASAPPVTTRAPRAAARKKSSSKFRTASCEAYLSLGSNVEPEKNLRKAIAALRERFGDVVVSPVYRTPAVGFNGPDFLNAIAFIESDIHPFALNDWLHALEVAQGRDRRDASYSNRTLDIDIIYFGDLVLEGPEDFQLPRPELHRAFVLKPLADVAPDFVDPVRHMTLAILWAAHPEAAMPPERVALALQVAAVL